MIRTWPAMVLTAFSLFLLLIANGSIKFLWIPCQKVQQFSGIPQLIRSSFSWGFMDVITLDADDFNDLIICMHVENSPEMVRNSLFY